MSNLLMESQGTNGNGDTCRFWSPLIPLKINIFMWRFLNNGLNPFQSIEKRYSSPIASLYLLRQSCGFSGSLFLYLLRGKQSVEENMGLDGFKFITVLFAVAIWMIWKWKNSILFAKGEDCAKKKSDDPFPAIQILSKLWINNRRPNLHINWDNWCTLPHNA
ncbi:hypothetical protein OSB04_023213 [Centaurea solstitialis]|uniref:Reverse transcriptase zinc-binding domain-containing protein n=1 Tax=Centaurea solstitialis TaxID=347529 RepID=A0AA38SVJ2_9ASTR|nr:hypothetical protein OSB04_023213 [Centaurea solstitialis]